MTTDSTLPILEELAPNSLFGPYRIARLLGRGGMGAVYEAEHRADGRVVALKLLSVDLDKMDARERFLREGKIAAAINHPNAVYIYGTEEIEGTPAITMELVPGGTLDDKVKARVAVPWREAVNDILQVIDGLDAALIAGVLHRDVKPSNCFVGADGAIKIGDFGLSKPIDGEEQQKLTKTGVFLGTPVFSSPEQLLGEALDVRSDIYAVGVTFYYLLTGALPYQSGSMMQVVAAVLNGAPAPIARHRDDVPQAVVDVVAKAMARKTESRYENYEEFRAAVAGLQEKEFVAATLWDRLRAAIVDGVIITVLLWLVSAVFLPGMMGAGNAAFADWRPVAIGLGLTLLIVGVPEALWGAAVGKWVVGIRVLGPRGMVPGLTRASARIALLNLSDWATLAVLAAVHNQNAKAGATLLATVLFRAVFLITARRHNSYRLLHDVLTGTRVARASVESQQRRGEAQRAAAPELRGDEQRMGPYVVLGAASMGSRMLRGWDRTMHRSVWIVPRRDDAPELSAARRSLSRLTRLRWVGGRRQTGDSWDAFEAPLGEPLVNRLKRPVSWRTQQDWLQDIGTELRAARDDGTALTDVSVEALWVTPTDRLAIPDNEHWEWESDGSIPSGTSNALAAQLLDRIGAAGPASPPLARYATLALAAARTAKTPDELLSAVHATLGRTSTVTRVRRAAMILSTVMPIVAMTLTGWFSAIQAKRVDQTGMLMEGLLSFINDSAATRSDSVEQRQRRSWSALSGSARIGRALVSMSVMGEQTPRAKLPADTLLHQQRLAEVYIATSLRSRARDTVLTSIFANSKSERRQLLAILAKNSTTDSAAVRQARVLVDSSWKGAVPGNRAAAIIAIIPMGIAMAFLCLSAIVSVAAGLLARRGPALRGFQIDIVTASGAPASRMRILARNLVIWSVLAAPIPLLVAAQYLTLGGLTTAIVIAAGVCALGWVLAVWSNIAQPARGIAERVSGTYLVPE